jgi:cell division protein FtsB
MGQSTERQTRRKRQRGLRGLWARWYALVTAWLKLPIRQLGIHLVTLVLGLLTLSLLFNFTQQVIQSAALEAQRATLEARVNTLEAENLHMQGVVAYAESDAYVEHTARERLGFAREGDIVLLPQYVTPTPAAGAAPAEGFADAPGDQPLEEIALPAIEPPPVTPNWQGWWEAFTTPNEQRLLPGE